MNHLAEWSDSLSQGLWLFGHAECLKRVWMEFLVSHRVGPLTLALIHLIIEEPDWKCCRLLNCWWKQVWHACTHFFCTLQTHWLPVLLSVSLSLLLAGSYSWFIQSCLHHNKHFVPCYVSCTHYPLYIIHTLNLFSCFHHCIFLLLICKHTILPLSATNSAFML